VYQIHAKKHTHRRNTHTHTYSCTMVQALCRRSVDVEAEVQIPDQSVWDLW